jgi:hypothetical protein
MLFASSMLWFKKGKNLAQLVGIYHIALMIPISKFQFSSYRYVVLILLLMAMRLYTGIC